MRQFFASGWWSHRSRQTTIQILLLLSLIMLIVILLGAHGVRGTDQYWYLADVDTLIQGSKPLSNLYFPRAIIENREDANYFIHNGPALHLSAMLGVWMGAYNGWLTVNLLCHLLTAFCIYTAALRHTNQTISAVSCFLYFISPIAIWQTVNMMQEHFFAALLAVIIASYAYGDKKYPNLLLHVTLALSVAIHPLFATLATTHILINLYNGIRRSNNILLFKSICFTAVCAIVLKLYPLAFPTSFQPNLYSLIAGSIPKISSMVWHYSDSVLTIDIQLLISKLKHAVQIHASQPYFYFYTNMALLGSAYLVFRKKKPINSIEYLLSFVMALYAAQSILMQAQPRYQQIFAPATFVLIALILYETKKYLPTALKNSSFTLLASASMTVSVYLCYAVNIQAKNEQHSLVELKNQLASLPTNSNILLQDSEHETKLSYILKPRKILSVKSELLGAAGYTRTLSKFQPDFVISTNPLESFSGRANTRARLSTSYLGDFYIYKVEDLSVASYDNNDALTHTLFSQPPQQ